MFLFLSDNKMLPRKSESRGEKNKNEIFAYQPCNFRRNTSTKLSNSRTAEQTIIIFTKTAINFPASPQKTKTIIIFVRYKNYME